MTTDSAAASPYSRKNPFPAALLVNRKLTLDGSEKETRHLELSLAQSGLTYEPGDSLGVLPTNCEELVGELILALRCSPDELVPGNDGTLKPLRAALTHDYTITEPSKQLLTAVAERAGEGASILRELMDPLRKKDLENYLWGLEIIDFLTAHPSIEWTADEFVHLLRKLQPRLYSIASSQKMYPAEVHLTVAAVRYQSHGRGRKGVASTYLADRIDAAGATPVFIHVAKGFRLPEGDTPIIMVGPGTGVAPFRAYLQERKVSGARGKNWLFFGEQRSLTDFLYRDEFETFQAEGVLTHLHTAFSRDGPQKVYVQHRMEEQAAELWGWLEQGAYFYVCGDARHMAKDVDATLHRIVTEQGSKTPEQAAEYVENLKQQKRYRRDVY